MKKIILIVISIAFCMNMNAQPDNQVYDSTLARALGADEYGMKSYVLAILKTGSNNLEKGSERDNLFRGHMANINRLAESGKLIIAGPLGENDKTYQGIFILNVKTINEAQELLQTDPTIKAKVLDAELYEWYGSAAIGEYLKMYKKIVKKKI